MKKVKVVTSFLERDGKILILRRSDKVRTMKHKWAAISGYLEEDEDALERAFKEIQEEVGLTTSDVTLMKTAEPLEATDKEYDTIWIVYPHLFKALSAEIKLDWEHDVYKWINPNYIASYDTVPMLEETLQRCLC